MPCGYAHKTWSGGECLPREPPLDPDGHDDEEEEACAIRLSDAVYPVQRLSK